MHLLILGGSQFLGRAIAAYACASGHDVTCAARGLAGPIAPGACFVHVDRDAADGLAPLMRQEFDAVVDVSRHPGQVRRAVAALRRQVGHWSFISTVSVYADNHTPGQRADTAPLKAPTAAEIEYSSDETYGAAKAACEEAVGESAFICRPGLIVGPEDPTGRFTWPARIARGGEVLAPGTPEDTVQFIDVRDLAEWIVHAAQIRLNGIYDAIGPTRTRGELLAESPQHSTSPARSPGSIVHSSKSTASNTGRARGRSRCGCPCPSSPASQRATRHPHATQVSTCARCHRPCATQSAGYTRSMVQSGV